MGVNFTPGESRALYRLLVENTTDVILKTDRDGFIVHAAPPLESVGLLPAAEASGRHLRDLVDPSRAAAVMAAHAAAVAGRDDRSWVEFAARSAGGRQRWFEIQTRGLADERGRIDRALSIVRSIDERVSFERKLFAAAMTDPLTGLTNRTAFVAMLRHLVERRVGGCLALFALDHFKAINLRYGHALGDQVLVVFAELVRTLTRSEDIISRIGGESFGVLLPRAAPDQAEAICQDIVVTLSEISRAEAGGGLPLTVSAGLARLAASLDETLRSAELALVVAKAKGRNRLEVDGQGLRLAGAPSAR